MRILAGGLLAILLSFPAFKLQAQLLWDNGPLYNSVGTGAGGANESVLMQISLGMSIVAYTHSGNARVADDFTVTGCHWRLDSIAFFGYQVNSGLVSSYRSMTLRIWDGVPGAPGSSVVYGDDFTDRLTDTRWSGTYRVWEGDNGNPARPIMRNVVDAGQVILPAGDYWLDWAASGNLGNCWVAPRTPPGQTLTGNGLQGVGPNWSPLTDVGGTGDPQGLPFMVYGARLDPVADGGPDRSICLGDSTILGGNPAVSGGYGPVAVQWSPGLGIGSTTPNPMVSPAVHTTYLLTVTDSLGCVDVDTVGVGVGAQSASFLPADTTLCDGMTVTIDAGPASSHAWSTGDTTQAIDVGAGIYFVDVDNGGACPFTDTIVVHPQQHAVIVGDTVMCPNAPDTLFVAGDYVFYLWSTGDTTPFITINSVANWSVTTTDRFGCISADAVTSSIGQPVTAAFSYWVSGGGLTYNFTNFSQNATSWTWDFGDGDSSTLQHPVHTYAASGTYFVRLKVMNACYNQTQLTNILVTGVADPLAADIIVSPQPASGHLRVQVRGLRQGGLEATLTDLQGRQVGSWKWENAESDIDERLDIGSHSPGMYLLTLRQGGQATVRKVVIGR